MAREAVITDNKALNKGAPKKHRGLVSDLTTQALRTDRATLWQEIQQIALMQ
jgi:hypothetical protein